MTPVTVKAVVSFEGVMIGDQATLPATPRIEALIRMGYLKELDRGPDSDRQVDAEAGGERGPQSGDAGGSEAGSEQGEDPFSGGHWTDEVIDQL